MILIFLTTLKTALFCDCSSLTQNFVHLWKARERRIFGWGGVIPSPELSFHCFLMCNTRLCNWD